MGKIRVAFIGTGNISHGHGRRLQELDDVEITAISDVSRDNRNRFISQLGLEGVQQFDDYKELLNHADADAVIICSPHTLHFQQATDVLNSGRHVLIEKPMTCTSSEAEQLIRTAEQTGKLLQVSYQRHFMPQFLYIKQAIESGVIGKLTSVTATLYQDWKQLSTGTWRQNPQLSGGGMLMDSGSHIIDILLWTTGLTPESVKTEMNLAGAPVEVDSFTAIRFKEGPVAGLNLIGFAPIFHETYGFCGEDGGIYYQDGEITIRKRGQEPIVPQLPEQTTNPDKSFIDAIRGKHEVLVPGSFALKVVQLTEMIYEAAQYKPY